MREGHQTVCYRAGDRDRELDLEERRERDHLKPIYLLCWPACFSGRFLGSFKFCVLGFMVIFIREHFHRTNGLGMGNVLAFRVVCIFAM